LHLVGLSTIIRTRAAVSASYQPAQNNPGGYKRPRCTFLLRLVTFFGYTADIFVRAVKKFPLVAFNARHRILFNTEG